MFGSVAESEQHNRVRVRLKSVIAGIDAAIVWQAQLPEVQSFLQRVRNEEVFFRGVPEWWVGPSARIVMQCQERSNAVDTFRDRPVIAGDQFVVEFFIREVADQFFDSMLNEKDSG